MGVNKITACPCRFQKYRLPTQCTCTRIRLLENERLWRIGGVEFIWFPEAATGISSAYPYTSTSQTSCKRERAALVRNYGRQGPIEDDGQE